MRGAVEARTFRKAILMDPKITLLLTAVAALVITAVAAIAVVALVRAERGDIPRILRELPAVIRAFLSRR
jgi:hypothetical protein